MNTLLLAGAAAATNAVVQLPPVTVYASRIDAAQDSIPAQVCVYTDEDIARSAARDLPDFLAKNAALDIHAMNGNPILTTVSTHGFGDNGFGRMKIVLDGEELNNVDMAAPNLTRIPLWSASRIEVVRGPSPVLYGDGAIGGVVNVMTGAGDYTRKTRISAKAGSQRTFGGNFRTQGGFEAEGVNYFAAYDYLQSDGYRRRSAWRTHTANAGIRKNFENGSFAALKFNYQNAFYELPGSLSLHQWRRRPKAAMNPADWTRLWSWGLSFDSKFKLAEDQYLKLDASFSRQYRHAKMAAWGTDTEYTSSSWAFSPRYINELDIAGFGNKFTIGADFRYDDYSEDPAAARTRRFNRARFAAFAQNEFYITDELSLIAGARAEYIKNRWAHYAGLRKSSSGDVMGDFELGLAYRPTDDLKLYAKATRFHRSAFCDETSYTQNGKFLDPETGESLDAGFEWKFLREFSFDANFYAMLMDDEIFFDPAILPYGYNCNSPARTRRIGLDAAFSWLREKTAEAAIRYGLVKADFASGRYHGCEVPFVPQNRLRLEGGVWLCDDLEIKAGYSFVSKQYVSGDFANTTKRLPSYSLFDISAHYSPSWAKGWKATFTIDNLLDRNYCDYAGVGYYYPACGRSFLATLAYEF